jgi:ectoine hydroxylase-related dioxygenase (phytanoyl-CoA dioxygenase family)
MQYKLLSEQEVERYYKDGFILKRDLFTANEKENLMKCANEIQSWPETPSKWLQYFDYNSDNQRILARTENFVPYIGNIFTHLKDKLLKAAGEILGEECKIYKDKIIYKFPGSHGFDTHQDGAGYLNFELRPHLVAMISVDRADKMNGCLQVIRGFPFNDSGEYEPELEAELLQRWDKENCWEYIETEPGDVFLFGMHVPHRSDANRDPVKTRRTFYLTLNRASEGECREKYFKAKRIADPPEIAAQSEHSISNVPNEHILGTNVKEENFEMYEFP